MENILDVVTIKLQIALNKKMYENGKITHDVYSKVNNILILRLTKAS